MSTKIANMKEFVKAVKSVMEEMFPDYSFEIEDVVKMNDIVNHGLVARRHGENYGPVLYLDTAYNAYETGEVSLRSITNGLADTLRPDMDMSFNSIKDKLSVRLVDSRKNALYLKDHPSKSIGGGLALVAQIKMDNASATAVVNNSMAEEYDLDLLFDAALSNAEASYPAEMISLSGALFGEDTNMLETNLKADGPYVLRTSTLFGASTLAYKGVLDAVKDRFDGDFYILPSSIHETILMKDDENADLSRLKEMVTQANTTVVEPDEVLSDSVFHYGSDGLRRVA